MVKNKKALILLLVFLAFLNSPAYPKDKRIKYLPSSQDIQTVSKDYSSSPIVLPEIGCPPCGALFQKYIECIDCVVLKGECPDCCLTKTSPKVIQCSPDDKSDNYKCTAAPFEVDRCALTECDAGTTGTGGSRGSDDSTDCDTLVCSGGKVSSGSPYRLQRRGCPDADSDELAPAGCLKCAITGTGENRVWTCPKTATCTPSSIPAFLTCSETSGPPRCDNLASYYDVKYVWENEPTTCVTFGGCKFCSIGPKKCASDPAAYCNSIKATFCSDQKCTIAASPCYYSCNCSRKPVTTCTPWIPPPPPWRPPPPPWRPPPPTCTTTWVIICDTCVCNGYSECTTKVNAISYIYSLNPGFKNSIAYCTTYADEYEKCRDRVDCCEQAVCGTGYDTKCNDASCAERLVKPKCDSFTAGQCNGFIQAAEECLEGATGDCFKEIDSNTRYDFVARTGEAYNVIWQINTTPDDAAKDSNAKFYTMVKVVDPTFAITDPKYVVYNSMFHQKGLNAAFSIYGTTLIPKGTLLLPGKHYQIQLHYFMYDYPATDYKVEINNISLTVTRVRE